MRKDRGNGEHRIATTGEMRGMPEIYRDSEGDVESLPARSVHCRILWSRPATATAGSSPGGSPTWRFPASVRWSHGNRHGEDIDILSVYGKQGNWES